MRNLPRAKKRMTDGKNFDVQVLKRAKQNSSETKDVKIKLPKSYNRNEKEAEFTEMVDMGKDSSNIKPDDIFLQILKNKQTIKLASQTVYRTLYHNIGGQSSCLPNFIQQRESGMRVGHQCMRKSIQQPIHSLISSLQLRKTLSPFDRRCTALEWHPTRPDYVVVGSKGGEIILWNINSIETDVHLPGIGPGGSIQALKFLPSDPRYVLTASIDGTVTQHDLEAKHRHVLTDTMNCHDYWYCSLDVNPTRSMLTAGENTGKLILMNMEGKPLWTKKLHRGKTTHAEFSRREDWLLCTASVDRTCQLWDVRMISDKHSAIATLAHDKPVNSAYFSTSDGVRLLTTDQDQQIRVYQGPLWHLEQTIRHPHRHFQHITPQKASWHTHQDTVVVGRYPDKNFPGYTPDEKRTIDIFDAETGRMICNLWDPSAKGIISLTKFNHQGDMLAATMGVNVLIWKPREEDEIPDDKLLTKDDKKGPSNDPERKRKSRKDPDRKRKDRGVTEAKLKILTQTQTKQRKK